MNGYIKSPQWVDIKFIYKKSRVGEFLQEYKWAGDEALDISCLNKEYKRNPKGYEELIKEFTLRGFEFVYERECEVAHNKIYNENEPYLHKMLDSQIYKSIDFEYLGLRDAMKLFHIESDRFFNYIPLKGFKALEPTVDLVLLEQFFVKKGFAIIRGKQKRNLESEVTRGILREFKETSIRTEEKISKSKSPVEILQRLDRENDVIQNGLEKKYFLEEYLSDEQYVEFIEFCKKNHIENLNEINYSIYNAYWNFTKQSRLKFEKIKYQIEKIKEERSIIAKKLETLDIYMNSKELEEFIKFCKKNNNISVNKINKIIVENYRISSQISSKNLNKQLELKEKVIDKRKLKSQFMDYSTTTMKKIVNECVEKEKTITILNDKIKILEKENGFLKSQVESMTLKEHVEDDLVRDQEEYEELIDRCEQAYVDDRIKVVRRCILEIIKYKAWYKEYMSSEDFINQLLLACLYSLQNEFLEAYPIEKYDGCTPEFDLYQIVKECMKSEIYLAEFNRLKEYIEVNEKKLKNIHYPIRNKILAEVTMLAKAHLKEESQENRVIREQTQKIKDMFIVNDSNKFFDNLKILIDMGPKYIKNLTEEQGFTLLFMAYTYDFNDFMEYECRNIRNWIQKDNIEAHIYQKLVTLGNRTKIQRELEVVHRILSKEKEKIVLLDTDVKEHILDRLLMIVSRKIG